jgi:hypothetical protein
MTLFTRFGVAMIEHHHLIDCRLALIRVFVEECLDQLCHVLVNQLNNRVVSELSAALVSM